MPSAQAIRDLSGCDLERRVQIDDAMSLVIMRVSGGAPRAQGQRPLRALQHLDRRRLINAEYHRVLGRVQVEPHDVADLRDESGIPTHLVGSGPMRLEVMAAQQVGYAAARWPNRLVEEPSRPAAVPRRRRRHRQLDHALDRRRRHGVIRAPRLRLCRESRHATVENAPSNSRDRFHGQVWAPRDLRTRNPVRAPQHDVHALHRARRLSRPCHESLQLA